MARAASVLAAVLGNLLRLHRDRQEEPHGPSLVPRRGSGRCQGSPWRRGPEGQARPCGPAGQPAAFHGRILPDGDRPQGLYPFDGYLSAFWYFLLLGEGLGLFDLVVIDLLWWRSTPRIRFSFLPDKAAYQDPGKHIGSFVRGIPLFAAVAALSAAIVTLL